MSDEKFTPGPRYSVGTWDMEEEAYTPQAGLSVPCINVTLPTLRQVIRELRSGGYSAHYVRGADGEHDANDPKVLVERTDGMTDEEVLRKWNRKGWIVEAAAISKATS